MGASIEIFVGAESERQRWAVRLLLRFGFRSFCAMLESDSWGTGFGACRMTGFGGRRVVMDWRRIG